MSRIHRCAVATHLALAAAALAQPCDDFMDFEAFPLGTTWGSPFDLPGDLAFATPVTDAWLRPHHTGAFNQARVELDPSFAACGFKNKMLRFDNINIDFDETKSPGAVWHVRFDYVDLGGSIDLRVNGGPMWVGTDLPAAPFLIGPGATLTVVQAPIPGGVCGTVFLDGRIDTWVFGGQEIWIDNVCVTRCYADFNADGALNILDFVAFQAAFKAGDPAADCNGDGALTILDYICFSNLFKLGC